MLFPSNNSQFCQNFILISFQNIYLLFFCYPDEAVSSPDNKLLDSPAAIAGKRKRKPPQSPEGRQLSTPMASWTRVALTLLGRVMKYRSSSKDRGRINGALWFNEPGNN